jgi:TetR/AcrR family transcriptional regulator
MCEDNKHRSKNSRQTPTEGVPLPEMETLEQDEIQQLATSMGMSRSGAWQLFSEPRKRTERLLTALHQRLMTLLDYQCSRSNDPLKTLEEIFHSHLRFMTKNPLVPRLLQHLMESRESEVHQQAKEIIRLYEFDILLIIRGAKAKGMLHEGVDTRAAASLFVSMLQGIVLRSQITGDTKAVLADAKAMIRGYLDTMRKELPEGAR